MYKWVTYENNATTTDSVPNCGDCPFNPFRDEEDLYTFEDGEPIK